MADAPIIAILLKDKHRLEDALRCGRELLACGAKVSLFCLCGELSPTAAWNAAPLLETAALTETDAGTLAGRYNLDGLSIGFLVQQIGAADWVIPF